MSRDRLPIAQILVASTGTLAACAALGAFGGCDIDMLHIKRGTDANAPSKMLLCLLLGLFIGIGVVLWRRPWRLRQSNGLRFTLQAGYAIAWMAVGSLALYGAQTGRLTATPVRLPLRFDTINTIRATFTAETSGPYEVAVDLQRKLPFEDLQALTGTLISSDKPYKGPPRPDIVWTVTDVADQDRTEDWGPAYWGQSVGIRLGKFEAQADHPYTVTVHVAKPSSSLQVLDPRLTVTNIDARYDETPIVVAMGAMLALLLGCILLIVSIVRWRRSGAQAD